MMPAIKLNREVMTFRQLIDGHYVVNVHFYADKNVNNVPPYAREIIGPEKSPAPVPCKVTIIKLNPKYEEIGTFLVILEKKYDERTAVSFDIKDGQIVNVGRDEELFVNPHNGTGALALPPLDRRNH